MRLPAILARRFVAGDTAASAVEAGTRLRKRKIRATFDLLGEDVAEPGQARALSVEIEKLLRAIPPEVERNVSIKPSMLGLDFSEDLCVELTSGLLGVARELDGFVRLDMEGSKHTDPTLRVFRQLRKDHDNVGIVLQAYLKRTEDDVKECVRQGDRVRLCKGAYKEPESLAFQRMPGIRKNFGKCARLLLEGAPYPAIATHDEELITDVIGFAKDDGVAAERFEFQMLYGLRPRRWDSLVSAGYNVRVYVPYGTHWFPYFYRRLRERKENVWFVLRNVLWG